MKVLIVGHHEVPQLLPMSDCVEVMAEMFRTLARGEALLPPRQVMWQPGREGALGLMPVYLGSPAAVGVKAVTVFPGNDKTRYESHQGAVMLFETANGRLQALVDASSITAIRTAAVSALATRILAREDAGDLAILGSGTQASKHLEAMRIVRPIRRVRVWSRNAEHARRFAEREGARHGLPIAVMPSAQEAVAGADIICTVTGATSPILRGEWVMPGAHINAVGASVPPFRELDTAMVVRSHLFVDRREATLNEADDLRIPLQEGAITADHIRGELADLVLGRVTGRPTPDAITLFKSVGLAAEDLAAVHHVYTQALAKKAGTWVEFGGERFA